MSGIRHASKRRSQRKTRTQCKHGQSSHAGTLSPASCCRASEGPPRSAQVLIHQTCSWQSSPHHHPRRQLQMARLFAVIHSQTSSDPGGTFLKKEETSTRHSLKEQPMTQRKYCRSARPLQQLHVHNKRVAPFFPPASTTMLQMVIRSSMFISSIACPVNSIAR